MRNQRVGGPSRVLLLGTDDRNVLAWANRGYAQQGAASILNQETEKWIARRRMVFGRFYIRSGRNFSAYWISSASLGDIIKWPRQAGFGRIRFRARRNDPIADCGGGPNRSLGAWAYPNGTLCAMVPRELPGVACGRHPTIWAPR